MTTSAASVENGKNFTLTITPEPSFVFDYMTIKDGDDVPYRVEEITDNKYTYIGVTTNVSIVVYFKDIDMLLR